MKTHAYLSMLELQQRHWWWHGMARFYHAALQKHLTTPESITASSKNHRILDIGCGYGVNLPVLSEFGQVVGVDVSLDALKKIDRSEYPSLLGLVQARADALPFRRDSFDTIAMLAVIEHVKEDDRALCESARVAAPHALQLILTSAFMALWSGHDVANCHYRRYREYQLNALQQMTTWQVLQSGYLNAVVFIPTLIVRFLQRCFHSSFRAEYDMGPDHWLINKVLEWLLAVEVWLTLNSNVHLPFGVDVFSISRKIDENGNKVGNGVIKGKER